LEARPHLAFYCATCVVLNPADVTAPTWKRAWLAPSGARCDVRDMQVETSGQQCAAVVLGKFLVGANRFYSLATS